MSLRPMIRVATLALAIGGFGTVSAVQAGEPDKAAAAKAPEPAASKTAEPAAGDPVVARVDGIEIHRSAVLTTIAGLPPQVRQMPTEMVFPAVLDQMINGKLVAAAAAQQNLQDDPVYQEKLKRSQERAMQEVFLARAVKARITNDLLQARYKKYLTDNPPQEEVRASHILVATEAEAKALVEQLKGGADFAKLAKEKSTDTAAAAQGGDLGFFTRDAMVAPFSEAAFNGAVGKVIETPVHTQFGWHVIRVDERRKGAPPALDDVRADLETELSQEIVTTVVADLRAKAKVEEFRPDGSPLPKEAAPAKP